MTAVATPVRGTCRDSAGVDLLDLLRRWSQAPDAVAVRAGEQTMTYRELTGRSDRLAERIAALGIPPGSPVAVPVDRPVELPAFLAAVAKAGHHWWPATAAGTPAAAPAAVIATEAAPAGLPDGVPVLWAHRADPAPAARGPAAPPEPDEVAGLLPVAGAGVLVAREPLMALLHATGEELGVRPGDRVVVTASPASAPGLADILLGLVRGAEVILVDGMPDPARLAGAAGLGGRTFLITAPAVWHRLLSAGLTGTPGLVAVCRGEPLPGRLTGRLLAVADAVFNGYGPAETGGYGLLHRVTDRDSSAAVTPVGRPIGPFAARVLDDTGRAASAGELYLADPGLVLARPGRSAAENATTYRPDPWATTPGARMLRTGMSARHTPDGVLELRGDVTEPIHGPHGSVRPFDAEEAVLTVPGVALAPVVARTDDAGRPHLVAYVVADPAGHRPAGEIEEEVSLALSSFPVPYRVVLRPQLPVTTAGVIDREALPDPDTLAPPSAGRPPQTREEQLIAGIWAELLGIPTPAADVGFFEAGGYSLAVTRLANRLEQAFGFVVPLAELFTQTTVAAQARVVERLYEQELAQVIADDDEDGRFVETGT